MKAEPDIIDTENPEFQDAIRLIQIIDGYFIGSYVSGATSDALLS